MLWFYACACSWVRTTGFLYRCFLFCCFFFFFLQELLQEKWLDLLMNSHEIAAIRMPLSVASFLQHLYFSTSGEDGGIDLSADTQAHHGIVKYNMRKSSDLEQEGCYLQAGNQACLEECGFNATAKTIFIIHGWTVYICITLLLPLLFLCEWWAEHEMLTDSCSFISQMSGMFENWMHKLVSAVMRRENEANVVVVDWIALAQQLYPDAVNHTRDVGLHIADMLNWLQVCADTCFQMLPSMTHVLGGGVSMNFKVACTSFCDHHTIKLTVTIPSWLKHSALTDIYGFLLKWFMEWAEPSKGNVRSNGKTF